MTVRTPVRRLKHASSGGTRPAPDTVDYGKHNMTTATAAEIVAHLMRHLGYREAGKHGKMPAGCVAKSAMLWERKDR